MAVTKILAKHARLDVLINYALNGDKTEEKVLTASHNCDKQTAYFQMKQTKEDVKKTDGVQAYHLIQSFAEGEVTPELALQIARKYVRECIPEYEAVIGVHVNTGHIHTHIIFNSVNLYTGQKYHSNTKSYYQQIRGISDRICHEHGLNIIIAGEKSRAVHYYEWMRQKRGLPTYRSMLEADLKRAIEDAGDYGHFLMLMENMGYEIKHGSRLSFCLRGTDKWYVPGRKKPLFTEEGIRAAIKGNLEAIEAGLRPAFIPRPQFIPYKKHPKYTGFMALYVHYLYLLGKIGQRAYPPRMTPHLKGEVMKFEAYKAQFAFLREHGISTPEQLLAHKEAAEKKIAVLTKQRTLLNVKKKKRMPLFNALADAEALKPAKALYDEGMIGIEDEFARYMDAVNMLEKAGVPRDQLTKEKAEIYEAIAEVNREIRVLRKEIRLCENISGNAPQMQKDIHTVETKRNKEQARDKKRQI